MDSLFNLVRPEVRGLKAYHVEEPDVPVKLHANESPFNLSEETRREIAAALKETSFNRYPSADYSDLTVSLAARAGVDPSQVLAGNGSDDLIQMLIMAFGGHGGPVVFPVPTFSMYKIIASYFGEVARPVPLGPAFELDASVVIEAAGSRPSITFLSYPNNPTGNCFDAAAVEEVVATSKGIVVVDEAYFDYSGISFIDRLKKYPNLVILRTLSKVGFASMRLGFMIASPELTEVVNRVRLPYNINSATRRAAIIALEHEAEIDEGIRTVVAERDRLFSTLSGLAEVETFRSDSNFILFRVNDADRLFSSLIGKGVLIRNLSGEGPLENCLRVTAGTTKENDTFLSAMRDMA